MKTNFSLVVMMLAALLSMMNISCASKRAARSITPSIGTRERGMASWYGHPYHGRATASGEIYDMELDTAAHQRFAFGTWLRVDNLDNGKRTEVRVNDRGPFVRGRIVDLSRAAAREIDMLGPGTAKVKLTVIAAPPHRNLNAPPKSLPAPSSSQKRWGVQIASFRDATRARNLTTRLAEQGHASALLRAGEWTRVVVWSRDGSEEQARALTGELQTDYPQAITFSTAYPQP
jgi:rare lipoprotein A